MSRYTTELWASDDFPSNPVKCPRCGSETLHLSGVVFRLFDETIKDGKRVSFVLRENETYQETRKVTCDECKIYFYLDTE